MRGLWREGGWWWTRNDGHEMSMIGGGNMDMESEDEKKTRRWHSGDTWSE